MQLMTINDSAFRSLWEQPRRPTAEAVVVGSVEFL